MGIELKWLYLRSDLIRRSWELRRQTADTKEVKIDDIQEKLDWIISLHKEYLKNNKCLQEIQTNSNRLKSEIKKHILEQKSKGKKSTPPIELVKELKGLESKAKIYQTLTKEQFSKINSEIQKIPNVVDTSCNDVVSLKELEASVNQLFHTTTQLDKEPRTLEPVELLLENLKVDEYLKNRIASSLIVENSLGRKKEKLTSLLFLHKEKWLDEVSELPVIEHRWMKGDVEICMLCQGENQWSRQAFKVLTLCSCEYFCQITGKTHADLSVIHTLPPHLSLASTMENKIFLGDSCLAEVSCTTDFESRDCEIRCGPKKSLQNWKKYVHVIHVKWYTSTLFRILEQERVSLPSIDFRQVTQVSFQPETRDTLENMHTRQRLMMPNPIQSSIQGIDDIVKTENWLSENSFLKGSFLTDADMVGKKKLMSFINDTNIPLPQVQYPNIYRWLEALPAE